jgi:hypothetical protein
MESLPVLAPSCSLTNAELREQLGRYRAVGEGAEVIAATGPTRAIRVSSAVPESLVDRLVEVERGCCPIFVLAWDPASRRLTISVSSADQEPALEAIAHAMGLADDKQT